MTVPLPLPTFLVIGAQKSATRWLRVNLGQHPDIYVADRELMFFQNEDRVRTVGLEGYRQEFEGWGGEPIVGEATPGYLMWHHDPAAVADRIATSLPDVRLVAMLRNPVDRARSALIHHVKRGRLDPDTDLVELARLHAPDPTRPPERPGGWGGPEAIIGAGWYATCLRPYHERFGDRLLVVLHDDLADAEGVYQVVLGHLGADPTFRPPDLGAVRFSNEPDAGRAGRQLGDEDRRELFSIYRDDVAELESMIGRDLSAWDPDR